MREEKRSFPLSLFKMRAYNQSHVILNFPSLETDGPENSWPQEKGLEVQEPASLVGEKGEN